MVGATLASVGFRPWRRERSTPTIVDAALDVRNRSFGLLSSGMLPIWMERTTRSIEAGRVLGVYDGGTLLGLARINDLTQWWAGRSLPMAGVAGVVIAPEHRGRGVGTKLMAALLDRARSLDYPISALYAATVPVYRAIGYELAGAEHKITVSAEAVRSLGRGSTVETRRATPADAVEIVETINKLHEQHRDCGPIGWSLDEWKDDLEDDENFSYLAADGFLMYGWDGSGGLEVQTIVAGSEPTIRALWSIVGSGSSIAKTINAVISPHDPIRWLLRDGGLTEKDPVWWMLRLLDAPAAIEGRGFPAGVSVDVPVELADPQLPDNTGRYRLTIAGGAGALEPDPGRAPALAFGANGLAALYAGTPTSTLLRAGVMSGGSLADHAALDLAFAARPFMLDYF